MHTRALPVLAAATAVFAAGALPAAGTPSRVARVAEHRATGRTLFRSSGCGACHTLKPAGTRGTAGPNLDVYDPPYVFIVKQITSGGGGMPAFRRRLSKAQIKELATFVYTWTSRP